MVESLGSDKFVYFTQELGQTHNVAELEELARDSGRADIGGSSETVVARLDPASPHHRGRDARLWVDVRKLHVFDPATGRNLTLHNPAASAGPAAGTAAAAGTTAADADSGTASTTAAADAGSGEASSAAETATGSGEADAR